LSLKILTIAVKTFLLLLQRRLLASTSCVWVGESYCVVRAFHNLSPNCWRYQLSQNILGEATYEKKIERQIESSMAGRVWVRYHEATSLLCKCQVSVYCSLRLFNLFLNWLEKNWRTIKCFFGFFRSCLSDNISH
jgi:hypothetical protein